MRGAVAVNVLSVLTSGDSVEFCVETMPSSDIVAEPEIVIKPAKQGQDTVKILSTLMQNRDFIEISKRKGKQDGVSYVQTLFIYTQDTDVLSKIERFV